MTLQRKPKVIDVARLSGVSTATVSRVLNDPAVVSEATREAVLAAVKQTGYRVNRAARSLRTNTSRTILALVPNLSNPFFSNILSGLERELSAADYSLLITDSGDAKLTADHIQRYVAAGQADGLIILDGGVDLQQLEVVQSAAPTVPIVFACEWVEGFKGASVRADNAGGIRMLVDHLWQLGHRKFGHVSGPDTNVLSHYRQRAFEQHVVDLGGELRPEWILPGDFSIAAGKHAAAQVINMPEKPTAWICASDQIAFGLIAGLTEAGVRVPADVSVTGFDNIEMTEVFNPPLTTIHQHRNKMGNEAARRLLAQLHDYETEVNTPTVMPVYLVERQSTGPVSKKVEMCSP
ncbi:LacI family DNA-binding transcriptional regulator [Shimia sagamensis]|uniref:Transcriptional regulator, LacI family n=1 Tax=Shimia sagamensis TaxID=1566352 RepID=A0ABY1PGG4_9RHOB|nr:LacI family DNA-binding transcriptional regulator [Shimia sagamensis]SMP33575.1 transcriptional regulator, LacI family [Shimia sagamensis]